jgi:molybdate transport system substrate-binding protein
VIAMQEQGTVDPGPRAPLGRVRTGLAVPSGRTLPDVASAQALKATLLAAKAIYFPDPQRSTAGIHFASVIERLGITEQLASRVRNYPNGAISMRELGADETQGTIGCTQITEILYTPGVELVGALPGEFELATIYTAARTVLCAEPALAQRFVELLAGPETGELRTAGGFQLD